MPTFSGLLIVVAVADFGAVILLALLREPATMAEPMVAM